MPNQADMLLAMPQIKPKFLEELLEILGTPNYIIFRVPNKEYKIGNITVNESVNEQPCISDNEGIMDVYKNKNKECTLSNLQWYEHRRSKLFHLLLSAKFTPYRFDLRINRKKLSDKYNKLVDIIDKYRVPNSLTLIHEERLRAVRRL